MKQQFDAGSVAIQQAMRHELKMSYRKIGKILNVHHRSVWQHVAAQKGSNVLPWEKRTQQQQKLAIEMAKIKVRESEE